MAQRCQPSGKEITARLDTIVPYTKYCPESHSSICRLKMREVEVESLRAKYLRLPDDDGVELRDGSKIKLVGPDLGILVAKREHKSPVLERHNQRLQRQGQREFSLKASIGLSRLDWAVFESCESRVLGNRLGPTDIFTNEEQVSVSGDLESGATVFKIGRSTTQTEEVAIISSVGASESSYFASDGDSGSLVINMTAPFEVAGLVVAKNESEIPRWVAVTPLWAILEDVKNTTGMEVQFCSDF
ncbi:hypothetical protein L873DRAFT_1829253 [Choiromyces venosus 120613-1]|uniref:Uncharacterized protein n=1 Tax=Choiromyces venosus 120613-1 TaxID=1336337 RepID=A0A3N4JSP1_9PEZI|nr:hypothetical protein L873DRAFT_1829253 [Choiromyces venosus 120613-1]